MEALQLVNILLKYMQVNDIPMIDRTLNYVSGFEMNMEEFGNLDRVSIPSLLVARITDKQRKEPTMILGSSFGLGLS